MTIRNTPRMMSLAVVFLAATSLVVAREQGAANSAQAAALTQTMPVDPQITVGKLPNGLRYYVRANKKPEKRAELRLVVNAGSILEDDDQQGLAHFVEHMAFNGTKQLSEAGARRRSSSRSACASARDVNAYTSFDETVYMLQVPTDKPDVLDKALLILEDWAHNVTFDPAEIDKERGVVIEEWRLRPRRRRAHAGQAVPDAAQGLALRRPAADRQAGDPPELQAER